MTENQMEFFLAPTTRWDEDVVESAVCLLEEEAGIDDEGEESEGFRSLLHAGKVIQAANYLWGSRGMEKYPEQFRILKKICEALEDFGY